MLISILGCDHKTLNLQKHVFCSLGHKGLVWTAWEMVYILLLVEARLGCDSLCSFGWSTLWRPTESSRLVQKGYWIIYWVERVWARWWIQTYIDWNGNIIGSLSKRIFIHICYNQAFALLLFSILQVNKHQNYHLKLKNSCRTFLSFSYRLLL